MIEINLLGSEYRAVRKSVFLQAAQPPTALSAFILLAAVLFVGWRFWTITRHSAGLDRDSSIVQQERLRLLPELQQVEQFERRLEQVQQRVAFIERLRRNQRGPVHLLDQISGALADRLWLTRLKQGVDPSEVTIEGHSTSLTSLSDFVESLEGSGYFRRSVEIVSTQLETSAGPPGGLIRFQVRAVFEHPPGEAPAAALAAVQAASPAGLN
jgi:Tfp pilus assembly protein PilN